MFTFLKNVVVIVFCTVVVVSVWPQFMDNVDTALAEVIEGLEWVRDSFDTETLGVK